MQKIITMLMEFNFSKMEAKIYITLLGNPQLNGSQIAKNLGIPRSTTYNSLESLTQKDAVTLCSPDSNQYIAKDPDELFEKLKENYIDVANTIKKELAHYKVATPLSVTQNISGNKNVIDKIKELISSSKKEIYLNTDFDINLFSSELDLARKRGVRIIFFTFQKADIKDLDIEYFYDDKFGIDTPAATQSLLIVIDFMSAFMATIGDNIASNGIYSENRQIVSTISENIHMSIYIHKLEKKLKKDLIDESIQLGTIQERGFTKYLDDDQKYRKNRE